MPTSSPPARGRLRRLSSGTVFVLACAAFAAAFVAFLVFVSPTLLQRTLAQAPPPAPQVVGRGQLGDLSWRAEAVDGAAGQHVVDDRGVEAIVDPEPCLRVALGGERAGELCVARRGPSLRGVRAVEAASGAAVVYGIVAPEVSAVELALADGATLDVAASFVDFGFPLGFFTAELDAGASVAGIRALDAQGRARASATCASAPSPVSACDIREGPPD